MRCELELGLWRKRGVFRALDRRGASNLLTASTVKLPPSVGLLVREREGRRPSETVSPTMAPTLPCLPQPGTSQQRKALQTNWSKAQTWPS